MPARHLLRRGRQPDAAAGDGCMPAPGSACDRRSGHGCSTDVHCERSHRRARLDRRAQAAPRQDRRSHLDLAHEAQLQKGSGGLHAAGAGRPFNEPPDWRRCWRHRASCRRDTYRATRDTTPMACPASPSPIQGERRGDHDVRRQVALALTHALRFDQHLLQASNGNRVVNSPRCCDRSGPFRREALLPSALFPAPRWVSEHSVRRESLSEASGRSAAARTVYQRFSWLRDQCAQWYHTPSRFVA